MTHDLAPGPAPPPPRHERLRELAPAMQHEVNNALMVLGANLDLLGRSAAEGAPRRQLARAQDAAKRLDELVRGFLDLVRRPSEDPALISPVEAVAQLLPLLRVALGPRFGVELDPAAVPAVQLDRARLDLALLALARDAAGRMAQGTRILLRGENRGGEVALVLTLPDGAMPEGEAARLLIEAVRGGRLEAARGGVALVWAVG